MWPSINKDGAAVSLMAFWSSKEYDRKYGVGNLCIWHVEAAQYREAACDSTADDDVN